MFGSFSLIQLVWSFLGTPPGKIVTLGSVGQAGNVCYGWNVDPFMAANRFGKLQFSFAIKRRRGKWHVWIFFHFFNSKWFFLQIPVNKTIATLLQEARRGMWRYVQTNLTPVLNSQWTFYRSRFGHIQKKQTEVNDTWRFMDIALCLKGNGGSPENRIQIINCVKE